MHVLLKQQILAVYLSSQGCFSCITSQKKHFNNKAINNNSQNFHILGIGGCNLRDRKVLFLGIVCYVSIFVPMLRLRQLICLWSLQKAQSSVLHLPITVHFLLELSVRRVVWSKKDKKHRKLFYLFRRMPKVLKQKKVEW